jgi:MFS family permease
MILSLVVASLIGGVLVTIYGYYAPFMILSTILMGVGAGLITTFRPDTGTAHWLGFQVVYGLGVGFGMQNPVLAVQTVLNLEDIPTGTSLVMFMQTLGKFLLFSLSKADFDLPFSFQAVPCSYL